MSELRPYQNLGMADLPDEMWLQVSKYEDQYQVSNYGRIKSTGRLFEQKSRWGTLVTRRFPPKIIVQTEVIKEDNYRRLDVKLGVDKIWKTMVVAHLVASAFIGQRPDGYDVAHNDGDSLNNFYTNLRYSTPLQNTRDKFNHGTMLRGSDIGNSKLIDRDVVAIKANQENLKGYQLAELYGISQAQVSRIRHGTRWGHIP